MSKIPFLTKTQDNGKGTIPETLTQSKNKNTILVVELWISSNILSYFVI